MLLSLGAIGAVLASLPGHWLEGPPPPPSPPLQAEALVTKAESRATAAPRGGQIEDDGTLTILSAPGSEGRALPWSAQPSQWGVKPQASGPLAPAMRGGIRALFRVVPPAPARTDGLIVTTMERNISFGRLVLVRGCFRMNGPNGPIAVFPPGTTLGLVGGFLMVGSAGFPPALSARVGEHVFWEGKAITRFEEGSRKRVASVCGAGAVQTVSPASATVQQASNDGFAASQYADRYGIPWADALRAVERCRKKLEQSLPDLGGMPFVDNPCGSTPPVPVENVGDCPAGTRLRAGVCVTPEGYLRPVPPG